MKTLIFISLFTLSTIASEECGHKFAFDLKYEKGKISYDGGFFNTKKDFCDTSKFESNSNLKVQLITSEGKSYDKRIYVSENIYKELVIDKSKIKIADLKEEPVFRQVQFELPKDSTDKEVTLRVSNLENKTLLKEKIKISNK